MANVVVFGQHFEDVAVAKAKLPHLQKSDELCNMLSLSVLRRCINSFCNDHANIGSSEQRLILHLLASISIRK